MHFITMMTVSASLCCALAQQHGGYHPTQYFYLSPNNVASISPAHAQQLQPRTNMAAIDDDEELEASQFHSQDGDGRFAFGYSMPDQVRIESRNIDGSVRGSYSYLDPAGKTIKVQYWDDGSGFHSAGNNLPTEIPQPVQDTPEVQAARAQHFRLYQEALALAASSQSYAHAHQRQQGDALEMGDAEEGIVVESDSHTPVDEKGVELTRYPKLQIPQNLFDPAQVHDAKLEAVIVENPEILGPSFDGNSVRSGKSDAGVYPHHNVVVPTPGVRKGFSYSFSYPIPPTPVRQPEQPSFTYPGSQYGYMGLRSSKGLGNTPVNPTNQHMASFHHTEIPFSYTFPVPATPEGATAFHHAIQQDPSFQEAHTSGVEKQPPTLTPSARKGFSYSFSYPVKAKTMDNTQFGFKSMRYVRSTDGVKAPHGVAEKKVDAEDKGMDSRSGSTYIEVKPVLEYQPGHQSSFPQETDELKSLFARMGNNPIGLSQKAVDHGSIPIAAVHDAQVAPYQHGTFKNHQIAPVFYGSFQKKDANYGGGSDGRGEVVSGLTKVPPVSVSEKAAYFGAIPVAAVHDQQVAPYQRDSIRDHQTLPLYIEHVAY